jgi:hypothetical protein
MTTTLLTFVPSGSAALTQLRFTSLAVVNAREGLHVQDHAHAGRTIETLQVSGAKPRGACAALSRAAAQVELLSLPNHESSALRTHSLTCLSASSLAMP